MRPRWAGLKGVKKTKEASSLVPLAELGGVPAAAARAAHHARARCARAVHASGAGGRGIGLPRCVCGHGHRWALDPAWDFHDDSGDYERFWSEGDGPGWVARHRELAALAADKDRAWKDIDTTERRGTGTAYDQALRATQQLAEAMALAGRGSEFVRDLAGLVDRHRTRPAWLARLDKADLWRDRQK